MPNFRELDVWKRSHKLTLDIYAVTHSFPREERFGLTPHLRKTAASIPTNIAEGSGRLSRKEYRHFISIAMGSASETEYQLQLAADLGYLEEADSLSLTADVLDIQRMLRKLEQYLATAS